MGTSFFQDHWFDLLQSCFITGSFLLTALAYKTEGKSRRLGHLIALQENRRSIWEPMFIDPKLARIRKKTVDLQSKPITPQERLIVKLTIGHLYMIYEADKEKLIASPPGIMQDVRQYFALPIPLQVWREIREYQCSEFAGYIEAMFEEK